MQLSLALAIVHPVYQPVPVVEGRGKVQMDRIRRQDLDSGCYAVHEESAVAGGSRIDEAITARRRGWIVPEPPLGLQGEGVFGLKLLHRRPI